MSDNTILSFKIAFFIILLILIITFFQKRKQKKQLAYIENYKFPTKIALEIKKAYPHLSELSIQKVLRGLKDYFYISNISAKDEMIGMPSKVVDLAWHEFILFTKEYQVFCQKAFGRFHHHIPAEAMKNKNAVQLSLLLAWKYACKKENIYAPQPSRLPLLFAMDTKLNIEDGYKYTLNCNDPDAYCVKNFGKHCKDNRNSCGGGCGGASGCSSGCGGGCGG